uniref:Uncharacterized protein n=1 Tax=Branchiostoma floridae TaxID=7739 RepID=C3YHF0_BRAFL|eukprot:XP_002604375.1 hypothetical protein BRAFLDRAFT_73361 [Branchiostoma floridae]
MVTYAATLPHAAKVGGECEQKNGTSQTSPPTSARRVSASPEWLLQARITKGHENPCLSHPCLYGGTCEAHNRTDLQLAFYTCTCPPLYTGDNCGTIIRDTNITRHCYPQPCYNGGTCHEEADGFSCSCLAGVTGALCETDVDECDYDSQLCSPGGVCINLYNNYRLQCQCPAGYQGRLCEVEVIACSSAPCQHGGTCTDTQDGFSCTCPPGLTGRTCADQVDACASEPCTNGGTCLGGWGNFTCLCTPEYAGLQCERPQLCSYPLQDPCQNGAVCFPLPGGAGAHCVCLTGFTGDLCQTNIDDCQNDPCGLHGRCVDGVNSYSCVCDVGYQGQHCQEQLQLCRPNPCRNHGFCCAYGQPCGQHLQPGERECYCANGYTGQFCQVELDECSQPDVDPPCLNGGLCVDAIEWAVPSPGTVLNLCLFSWVYRTILRCTHVYSNAIYQHYVLDTGNDCFIKYLSSCADICTHTDGVRGTNTDGIYSINTDGVYSINRNDICSTNADGIYSINRDDICSTNADGIYSINRDDICSTNTDGIYSINRDDICSTNTDETASVAPTQMASDAPTQMASDAPTQMASTAPTQMMSTATTQTISTAPPSPCDSNPCQNGGSCDVDSLGWFCTCIDDWLGQMCELDPFVCIPDPCVQGFCFPLNGAAFCDCFHGFTGTWCEVAIVDCDPDPCVFGRCSVGEQGFYQCECEPGYGGVNCSETVSVCASQPCLNGGTCVEDNNASFNCSCADESDQFSAQFPPSDHGSQIVRSVGYVQMTRCDCPSGYYGDECEQVDWCADHPCQNNGTCSLQTSPDSSLPYSCLCLPQYFGAHCELRDACTGVPCGNGTCVSLNNSTSQPEYRCQCQPGYSGDSCNISACDGNRCQHNGRCLLNEDGQARCLCRHNYTGNDCSQDQFISVAQFHGQSYLQYPQELAVVSSRETRLAMVVKTTQENCLLVWLGDPQGFGDFLSLGIYQGQFEFRSDREGEMTVTSLDGTHLVFTSMSPGGAIGLNAVNNNLYVGGHPSAATQVSAGRYTSGLVGCVASLEFPNGGTDFDLQLSATDGLDISNCPV